MNVVLSTHSLQRPNEPTWPHALRPLISETEQTFPVNSNVISHIHEKYQAFLHFLQFILFPLLLDTAYLFGSNRKTFGNPRKLPIHISFREIKVLRLRIGRKLEINLTVSQVKSLSASQQDNISAPYLNSPVLLVTVAETRNPPLNK